MVESIAITLICFLACFGGAAIVPLVVISAFARAASYTRQRNAQDGKT